MKNKVKVSVITLVVSTIIIFLMRLFERTPHDNTWYFISTYMLIITPILFFIAIPVSFLVDYITKNNQSFRGISSLILLIVISQILLFLVYFIYNNFKFDHIDNMKDYISYYGPTIILTLINSIIYFSVSEILRSKK